MTYSALYGIIKTVKDGKALTNKGGKDMQDMGMTDKQFNGFIRFLIDDLKELQEETDAEKRERKLDKILENLQSTLED